MIQESAECKTEQSNLNVNPKATEISKRRVSLYKNPAIAMMYVIQRLKSVQDFKGV